MVDCCEGGRRDVVGRVVEMKWLKCSGSYCEESIRGVLSGGMGKKKKY